MFQKTPWLKSQVIISIVALLFFSLSAFVAVKLTGSDDKTIGQITLSGGNKTADLAMPYWNIEYVAGEKLSHNGGEAQAYIVKNNRNVDATAKFISVIFNVQGETWSADSGSARSVWVGKKDANNYADYNHPSIMVSSSRSDAPNQWSYSSAANMTSSISIGADGQPVDVKNPDESLMLETANSYLYGLNAPLDKIKIESSADYGYGTVVASLIVDGVESNIRWMFSFDSNNKLVSASGLDFTLTAAEKFATVSPYDAFKRIGDYRWNSDMYSYPMLVAYPEYTGGVSSGSGTASAASGSVGASEPTLIPPTSGEASTAPAEPSDPIIMPAPDSTVEPNPEVTAMPDPMPLPEKQIITVVGHEVILALTYDDEGRAYLLPAYSMFDVDKTHVNNVFAFVEGLVKLPENIIMPMMAENR